MFGAATGALAGAVAYLLVTACGVTAPANLVGGAFVIFGLRLAALKWQIRLPEFDSPK